MTFLLFSPSPSPSPKPPLTFLLKSPINLLPLNLPPKSCKKSHLFLNAISPETSLPISSHKDQKDNSNQVLEKNVLLLKQAAKTRMVQAADVISAISAIKKAKVDSSLFLETLGGSNSPGKTWMLVFTANSRLDKGGYFPVTAVQRFDAMASRIENGIYLGPIGCLTFEGKFSWKKKILAFVFEHLRVKIGPFGPFEISLGKKEQEPTSKDPFFIWFYIDDEIAVAQGKGGGFAFWCQCRRVENT